ncbi:hypothetical protein N824_04655 [Pedobacter sp. V48]|nr:hypothetical protein N824_04655 [Pedobacter sp. V48]
MDMKVYFLAIITFITVGFYACEKQKSDPNIEQKLIGKWDLKLSSGGFAGQTKPVEDGKSSVLVFKSKDTYQRIENGKLVKEGKYVLSKAKSIYSGQLETAISFNEVDTISKEQRKYILGLRSDSLLISDNYYDGYSMLYLRVK